MSSLPTSTAACFFDWTPFETFGRTDIYEKDGKLVYETELPGVKKEDIEIKVEDGRLVISGEVKRDERIERENYFRIGRHYGKFQRVLPAPRAGRRSQEDQGQLRGRHLSA
jgi:HSP20 family molecular chaperone IbpA